MPSDFAKASDVINYTDHTHVITDYRYDSFGRRIHTAEHTKSGMRTIYDGLSFEIVKEAEPFLGTRGITSSATGEANLNNYTPQVPQNGGPNNTAPSYGSEHTKGTRYYYIPDNAQGAQTLNNGGNSQSAPSYGSDHTKGTRYYYIPNNAQGAPAPHSAIPARPYERSAHLPVPEWRAGCRKQLVQHQPRAILLRLGHTRKREVHHRRRRAGS